MIDTIKLTMKLSLEEKKIILDNPNIEERLIKSDGELKKCKLRNANLQFRGQYLHLIVGLPTFKYGHNLYSIKHWALIETVEALENAIGIQLKKAMLNRIDVGQNIILNERCSKYLHCLMHKPGYEKQGYFDKGVNFINRDNSRVLAFYDKTKHLQSSYMRKIGKCVIDEFEGKNLLRYEMKLKTRLHQQMGKKLLVLDLFDKAIYDKLIGLWLSEFIGIVKSKIEIESKEFDTASELKDFLAFKGAEAYGEERLKRLVETVWKEKEQRDNAIKRHRALKMVNSLFRNGYMSRENDLMKELNSQITEAANLACSVSQIPPMSFLSRNELDKCPS